MDTVIDAYMPDIEKNHQLLVKNGLETIGSFVSVYKKHAVRTAENLTLPDRSMLVFIPRMWYQ